MTTIRQTHSWAGGSVWQAMNLNANVNTPVNDRLGRNGLRDLEASLIVLSGPDGDRFFQVPNGTTAQRPSGPEVGYLRFNTTLDNLEWWTGSRWASPGGTGIVTYGNLNASGGVGTGASQVARGNHTH